MLTIYGSTRYGDMKNTNFPLKFEVNDTETFKQAVSVDHVTACYDKFYRSSDNFLWSDTIVMDLDNDHSDWAEDWIQVEHIKTVFPDVRFYIASSRNHMKQKGDQCARPRFHVYFPVSKISDATKYREIKEAISAYFPYFDANALDSARLIFGNQEAEVFEFTGSLSVLDFIDDSKFSAWDRAQSRIQEGSRNSTMSRYAGRIIKRLGNTEEAKVEFLKKAELCEPPLPQAELESIWYSATKFFDKVSNQEGYIPPEEYGKNFLMKPEDYSDIGQAKVLAKFYGDQLIYTPATDYLRYDGVKWVENKQRAVGAMEDFLDEQLQDAERELELAKDALLNSGVGESELNEGGKKLEKTIGQNQMGLYLRYLSAVTYQKFVMKRRDMKYITSALQAAKPMLEVGYEELDKDPYQINCPDGTYDLRVGLKSRKDHDPKDLITKVAAVGPGDKGKSVWLDALDKTFTGDQELIDYVQLIVGAAAVGEVKLEALIISYGEGSNGKSTFWNTIAGVLGEYSGTISADTLTANVKRNVKPELAETKGKRLLIAAELEEGVRLSTSMVKQLCSTDRIHGEKKYKEPGSFVPSHMLVLYTNHLPKVGARDDGIWRRLIIIPFLAKITGKSDIKNFTQHLIEEAGPYVMQWIIEGARKAIAQDFKFSMPQCVKEAVDKYKSDNDWLQHFLDECCEVGASNIVQSSKLYEEYRAYCARTGAFTRSVMEFTAALEQMDFEKVKKRDGRYFLGLGLQMDEFL